MKKAVEIEIRTIDADGDVIDIVYREDDGPGVVERLLTTLTSYLDDDLTVSAVALERCTRTLYDDGRVDLDYSPLLGCAGSSRALQAGGWIPG